MAGGLLRAKGNSVYAGGPPRDWCTITLKAKTLTNLRAGVFVIKDTTDAEFKAAGAEAANVIGVLTERNLTNPKWDPTNTDAAKLLAAGDECEILLLGSGAQAWVRNGANIAAGAALATSATGRAAAKGTATFDGMVGRALIDNDGSGAESDLLAVI